LTFERRSHLSNLGKSAFEKCSSLRFICLPSSITAIFPFCFRNCGNLKRIDIEPGSKLSDESLSNLRTICEVRGAIRHSRSLFFSEWDMWLEGR
jgi:hypothetical protein